MSSRRTLSACALLSLLAWAPVAAAEAARLRFVVRFPASLEKGPLDGRLLLLLSTDPSAEPRFQVSDTNVAKSQQVFGIDVDDWTPGQDTIFGAGVLGFPAESLADVKPGVYRVQALLHRYEIFHRADGNVVKLPMDRGEGQQWSRAPGNLLSMPREIAIDPSRDEVVRIELEKAIPEIPTPKDTNYVRHVRIQSERLTKFWGRRMHLGAVVLLPQGFDEHPAARYPLAIYHGHFPHTFARPTAARWTTATGPSTAGTAITPARTRTRASDTSRCSRRRWSREWRRALRRGPTSPAGGTDEGRARPPAEGTGAARRRTPCGAAAGRLSLPGCP